MDRVFIIDYLNELTIIMTEKKEYLIELDSKVGDGDLGLTMSEGFKANRCRHDLRRGYAETN